MVLLYEINKKHFEQQFEKTFLALVRTNSSSTYNNTYDQPRDIIDMSGETKKKLLGEAKYVIQSKIAFTTSECNEYLEKIHPDDIIKIEIFEGKYCILFKKYLYEIEKSSVTIGYIQKENANAIT